MSLVTPRRTSCDSEYTASLVQALKSNGLFKQNSELYEARNKLLLKSIDLLVEKVSMQSLELAIECAFRIPCLYVKCAAVDLIVKKFNETNETVEKTSAAALNLFKAESDDQPNITLSEVQKKLQELPDMAIGNELRAHINENLVFDKGFNYVQEQLFISIVNLKKKHLVDLLQAGELERALQLSKYIKDGGDAEKEVAFVKSELDDLEAVIADTETSMNDAKDLAYKANKKEDTDETRRELRSNFELSDETMRKLRSEFVEPEAHLYVAKKICDDVGNQSRFKDAKNHIWGTLTKFPVYSDRGYRYTVGRYVDEFIGRHSNQAEPNQAEIRAIEKIANKIENEILKAGALEDLKRLEQ